jgi:hypothetical protein
MALNKEEKSKIIKVIELLDRHKDKPEISETEKAQSWRGKPPIPILCNIVKYGEYEKDLNKEGDLNDEELLRKFAEQTFSVVKDYPELMQELKAKYF